MIRSTDKSTYNCSDRGIGKGAYNCSGNGAGKSTYNGRGFVLAVQAAYSFPGANHAKDASKVML